MVLAELQQAAQGAVADGKAPVGVTRGDTGVQAIQQRLQEGALVLELLLGGAAVADVVQKGVERRAVVCVDHLQGHFDGELVACAVDGGQLEALPGQVGSAAVADPGHAVLVGCPEPLRNDQIGDRPADCLRGGVAEQAFGGCGPGGHHSRGVGGDQSVLGGVQHRAHMFCCA